MTSKQTATGVQLFYGRARSGTLKVRFSAAELAEQGLQAALAQHTAEGGTLNINQVGDRYWLRKGSDASFSFHRSTGPAIELADGTREWYCNGQRHRADGPAVERTDGSKSWYRHGQLHRADGPALVGADGTESWFFDGVQHRADGPAVWYARVGSEWWSDGVHHRERGPATITADGTREWWWQGRRCLNELDWQQVSAESAD